MRIAAEVGGGLARRLGFAVGQRGQPGLGAVESGDRVAFDAVEKSAHVMSLEQAA